MVVTCEGNHDLIDHTRRSFYRESEREVFRFYVEKRFGEINGQRLPFLGCRVARKQEILAEDNEATSGEARSERLAAVARTPYSTPGTLPKGSPDIGGAYARGADYAGMRSRDSPMAVSLLERVYRKPGQALGRFQRPRQLVSRRELTPSGRKISHLTLRRKLPGSAV
jgi:hypothetical protein